MFGEQRRVGSSWGGLTEHGTIIWPLPEPVEFRQSQDGMEILVSEFPIPEKSVDGKGHTKTHACMETPGVRGRQVGIHVTGVHRNL